MATEELIDPEVRQRVTSLLYGLLPELYRVWDEPPRGRGNLRDFLHILAAPLAQVRQSVEALQADLFIDSCSDDMLPALAEMVGTVLVFPDAVSNRRDLRATAAWRRRKGSVQTLESIAGELLDQLVITQEGWKRLLVTQDIRLARPERTVADMRDPLLAEQASGPREALLRAADVREISARTGRYHPLHITHWTHPTQLFPVRRGDARRLEGEAPRYAFHPLGRSVPLRVDRRDGEGRSDRVPPVSFDERPERFFGGEGGFTVRICGLPAAMATEELPLRNGSARAADVALVEGGCTLSVLGREVRGLTRPVRLEAFSVPLVQQASGTWRPVLSAASPRGGVILAAESAQGLDVPAPGPSPVDAPATVPMLRLSPEGGVQEAWFPGATVELAGGGPQARCSSLDGELAVEGFLRGSLVVRVPGLWLSGERWLHVAADGSVYEAGTEAAPVGVARQEEAFVFSGEPLAVGPGAAWPPLDPSAADTPLTLLPPSPTQGPVLMHAALPLRKTLEPLEPWTRLALAFAAVDESSVLPRYIPLLRLEWEGDFSNMRWSAVGDDGQPASALERFKEVAALARALGGRMSLAIRLEGGVADLILPPCEVAWTPAEGEPLLLYLPELSTTEPIQQEQWPADALVASPVVSLHADGSSRWLMSKQVARYALGRVAPLAAGAVPRRRRLRGRSLASPVEEPREGWLDVDPERGLFALAPSEPPQAYPERSGPLGGLPAFSRTHVTVDYQEGYSGHVGARPSPREPLLRERLPTPTRRVVRNGTFRAGSDDVPVYASLAAALSAIEESPQPDGREVVQLEDSATYIEGLTWPSGQNLPGEGKQLELTLQAAEAERPVLEFFEWLPPAGGTRYARITLRGLYLAGSAVTFPADVVSLQLCTVAGADQPLTFSGGAVSAEVELTRCVTAGLVLEGQGTLRVEDSVVDAGSQQALLVPEGVCALNRVTVLGATHVKVLEASESLFAVPAEGASPFQVKDRFHGYVRYSCVPEGALSSLPRPHRVVEDTRVRFVSRDRDDPAHARLAVDANVSVVRGAQDGSEMGAFHHVRLAQRYQALELRLAEYTPAGLSSGVLRLD
ncbi:MAG: hypothetical protein JXB05_02495 [Myxococcaceae bacterium]|nr:hypothetical protein [Myxococcaceae bacterium]